MSGYRGRLTEHQREELKALEFQVQVEESIGRHLGMEHQRLVHYRVSNPHITDNSVKSVYDRYMDSKNTLSVLQDAIRTITMNARQASPRRGFSRSHSFSRSPSRSMSRSRSAGGTRRHKRK